MIMRKLPIFTIFLSMLISGCSLEGTPGVNQPPVLEIEPVDPIIQGATVMLDASSSYDPDNDPLSYSWTLEDEELSTEAAFHRQFTEPGIYDIQLTIFDGNDKVFGAAKVLCVEEEEGEVIKIDDLSSYYLAYEHLNSDYLGDFDGGSLLKGSIPRMVEALDDEYAVYYTASEYEAFMDDMEGNLVGIGVYLTLNKEEGYPMVLGTISGSPAEEEGLLLRDLIIKVDEEKGAC